MMRWQWLVLGGTCLALGLVQPIQANAASQRGAITAVPTEAVQVTATKRLVNLRGSASQLQVTPGVTVDASKQSTWIQLAQTTVTTKGQVSRYIEIKNLKTGVRGWILAPAILPVATEQLSPSVKIKPVTMQTTTKTALYQVNGAAQPARLTVVGQLARGDEYQVTQTRQVTTAGRTSQYDEVGHQGWVLATALKVAPIVGSTTKVGTTAGMTTYRVTGNALKAQTTAKLPTVALVGHGRYTMNQINFAPTTAYLKTGSLQQTPSTLDQSRGYLTHYDFKTELYLPMGDYRGTLLNDPQSAAFSSNNRYLYVLYVDDRTAATNAAQTGWVVRYDWQRLLKLGAAKSGHMAMIRQAVLAANAHKLTKRDREILACLKLGPKFDSGHAQSLTLNPVTNELWFVQDFGNERPNAVERLNPNTLKPDAKVVFNLSPHTGMGDVLTFDDQGHAYFWTHAADSATNQPVGGVKIYRGQISTRNVSFQLVAQLQTRPGLIAQSMSYDDAARQLYLIADEGITTVPVMDLGHLTSRVVGESDFGADREFEGLVFMHHSVNGYLLTNRGVELMKLTRR